MHTCQINLWLGRNDAAISVGIPTDAVLEVYDLSGRMIKQLYRGLTQVDIDYRFMFDGSALPNGVNLYRLSTDSEVVFENFMIAL